MLISCPRCGFSQPQDQYCAQCGVDMQRYKPKQQPFIIQLLSSAAFQVTVLLIAMFFVGQYIINGPAPQRLVQKIFRSQGMTKSERKRIELSEEQNNELKENAAAADAPAQNLVATESASTGAGDGTATTAESAEASAARSINEANTHTIKLTFAEVPFDVISRWITESSAAGLYQSLPEYSIGILPDFKKLNDKFQVLKTSDLQILVGSNNTNLAGVMNDDNSSITGISTTVDLRSAEAETLLGTVNVVKTSNMGTFSYPSEFELPKGSAFYLIGALKIENFQAERSKLQMPPFQIFKSPDFMTHKTEFVIILEPVYK